MKTVAGMAYLTSEEMRRVDEVAVNDFGIEVLSLMENAGLQTALLARRMLGGTAAGKKVACLVGKGNNGGDGLVAARHLHDWGADVSLALGARRVEFGTAAAKQLKTAEKLGLPVTEEVADLKHSELVIDSLLGYGSAGDPRGAVADLILLGNLSRVQILALDIPSGLDPTTGVPNNPCIVAKATITLGFPKLGFLNPGSRPHVGDLYLCDISLPRGIYASLGASGRIFEREAVVRLSLPGQGGAAPLRLP
ncbi:MAG: NAD(P)H-hydrate epimerase [Nitrososphaerota archaeon]|nr:NAD(P)H-hydrate epimerase [Nitrososphaerota archaeon]